MVDVKYRLARAREVKRHKLTLHFMTQLYGIWTDMTEMLPVTQLNPVERSELPFKLEISRDKAASVRLDSISTEVVKVYTDRLAHGDKVGASAVLTRQGKADRVLRICLGTIKQHTVPEAEMVGLLLEVHLIATEKCN